MAEQVTFAAQRRTVFGKAVRQLRREGIVPGNIVVSGRDSIAIQVNGADFQKFLTKHHATTVVRLTLDGDKRGDTVMVQRVEHEPVTRAILHVDFAHVNMSETTHARVPIRIEGDAPGVKLYNAMVLTVLDHVEVEALPADLPDALVLDVGELTDLNASLNVGDLTVPRGVKVLTDPAESVVRLEPPRMVEPAAEPAAAPASVPVASETTEE